MSEQPKKLNPAWIPIIIFGGFVVTVVGVGWWVTIAEEQKASRACYSSWDERFHPRQQDGKCSILQRGLRVPAPYAGANVDPPEAREY